MGGKDAPKIKESASDKAQAAILSNLETSVGQPIRNTVVPQAIQTLGGPGVFQTSLPAMDRQAIEGQFAQARKNIMNAGTRSGLMSSQLANLNRDRAGAVSAATSNASQRGIERALGMVPAAMPNASAQLSARGSLGATEQARLTKQAEMNAQAQQAKGDAMGQMFGGFGSMMGGKS
jgi:hypothetical protein